MTNSTIDCIYRELHDGASSDEVVPSEEHVLSEALGGSFRLPKRLVCKACNNRLNSRVDMPVTRIFRGLLNFFRVQAHKHGVRDNAIPVLASSDGNDVEVKLLADGSFRPTLGPITEKPIVGEDGELQWGFRARDEEEAQRIIQGLSRAYSWKKVSIEPYELKSVRIKELSLQGKFLHIYRAAAKTALNYLIWRRPEFAHAPGLFDAKQFILNGVVSGKHPYLATTPEFIAGGPISAEGLEPVHRVAVGGENAVLRSTVVLFGKCWFEVRLSETFDGTSFHLEHEFELMGGDHRVVDFWGIHPKVFQDELAVNDRSRIRYGEFPSGRLHYLHEVSTNDGWMRCEECSSTALRESPTREEVLSCHATVTRRPR